MWAKSLIEWTENRTAYLSVVFTWDLPKAYQRAAWLREEGYHVIAGGPAVKLMPDYLADVAEIGGEMDRVLARHNPEATFTSRGCIRKCKFCAVPKIEGDLVELEEWEPKPIVCDNNLTACSWRHFCKVIERCRNIQGVDFNQGLDSRLLGQDHADLLAALDLAVVRLAWDHIDNDPWQAVTFLRRAGIPKHKIRIYVLIGFDDTPEDALYRLETIRKKGYLPSPQRYNPLDTIERDTYVLSGWSEVELNRYMRYWARTRFFRSIPFKEFQYPVGILT